MLNGGAPALPLNPKTHSPFTHLRWLPLTSIAVAAALMIYMVIPTPNGASNEQLAAIDSSPSLVMDAFSSNGADRLVSANDASANDASANDASSNLWNTNYLIELRSAVGYTRQQPILDPFYEVGSISQRLFSSSLVSSIASDGGSGWENPWRYTSELPGIRPFHRSVNVALVLYNDTVTLL